MIPVLLSTSASDTTSKSMLSFALVTKNAFFLVINLKSLLKSTDLVNWSHSVINMQKRYPGQEKLKRVWAPQTIYNKEVGKYMVYWSMQYAGGVDVIYYAYANEDFTDLEGEPKPPLT